MRIVLFRALAAACLPLATLAQPPAVPNPGFETLDPATGFAQAWVRGVSEGTVGSAEVVTDQPHGGARCLRITDATPHEAYRYVLVNTDWLPAEPDTTYVLGFHVRGKSVGRCAVAAAFEGAGEHRQYLPVGDYGWRRVTFRFTVPSGCKRIQVRFLADDVVEGLWIDDVTLDRSPVQLAGMSEQRASGPWRTWYPRTPGRIARKLCVVDVSREGAEVAGMMAALQGIVNRREARLYLINPTNPPGYDEMWLAYLQKKGHTGPEERLATPEETLRRFRGSVRGAAVWDGSVPGTRHAAWMLAGIKDLLPVSAETAARFSLPIVEDLRGRWRRSVDAWRDTWAQNRDRMSATLLAWEHPENNALSSRDVMVQQRVPMFWVSGPGDREPASEPVAEMEFVEEVLASTPGNVPVMGWPMYGMRGIEEYTAVRLLSEYGKWVPGTGYTSNGTVLSAARLPDGALRQPERLGAEPPAPDRVYLSLSIMDSGDAHWYWQFHQRRIWEGPARGAVPTGYGMNFTVVDALPPVVQWYYENRTPNDSFFGFIYMNAPVYASRFRAADRERIWAEFVQRTAAYMRRLDLEGLELYTGANSGPSAPPDLLRRFTRGIPGLRSLWVGLGRHADVRPDTAARLLDGVAVFDTLTDFRVWTESEDLAHKKMADENRWLEGEIARNTPARRPAFVSALAISWIYFPAWVQDLARRLPAHYRVVSHRELTRLLRAHDARPPAPRL